MTPRIRIKMSITHLLLLSTLLILPTTGQYHHHHHKSHLFSSDIQGNYCLSRIGGCCPGRVDDCSVPILGTLCYCDAFCNRTDNQDCCPDYYGACLGVYSHKAPEEVALMPGCPTHNGQSIPLGESVKVNCNQCTCSPNPSSPQNYELLCETDPCLINESLITEINEGDWSWKAGNHSEFWRRKLADGILLRLGTLDPERGVKPMKSMKYIYSPDSLPNSFDARTKWPRLVQGVKDQGWCGSDWAFAIADVTADRLAIQSKSIETPSLSPQHLLSCNSRGQQGCNGGHLDRGWNFMRKFGITDTRCYPYTSGSTGSSGKCKVSHRVKSLLEISECRLENDVLDEERELYRSQPAYKIGPEDIRHEIATFGPVMAVMRVTPDFFLYKSGVYKSPSLASSSRTGYHSIRIIGWGEEWVGGEVVKYWLCANSWGVTWGEEGLFKILRGEDESGIESFVVAAWARTGTAKSYRRKNPFF